MHCGLVTQGFNGYNSSTNICRVDYSNYHQTKPVFVNSQVVATRFSNDTPINETCFNIDDVRVL